MTARLTAAPTRDSERAGLGGEGDRYVSTATPPPSSIRASMNDSGCP